MDFDGEDYNGADSGYCVGDHYGDVSKKDSLDYKENGAKPQHKECWHGNPVGITRTDGCYRLRQIAKDHAKSSPIACYIYYRIHHYLIS